MKHNYLRSLLFALFILPLLLITACQASTPRAVQESNIPIPFVGGNDTEAEALPETEALPGTGIVIPAGGAAEVDALGIPVGFTADGRPYRGHLDAPVVMEEFSDFQCPFCARFAQQTLSVLLENQIANGEVVLIFYDYPLTSLHPQATAAANAARCAGEQGAAAYWAMHDRLFASIQEWSNNSANEVFLEYATELGLETESLITCMAEGRYNEAIQADVDLGVSRGVSSTPSFFLNNQPVIGAYPLDYFNEIIVQVKSGETIAAEPEPAPPTAPTVKPTPATLVLDDVAARKGDESAVVTIVEYTDYQCPYCARHVTNTLSLIISELVETGRVRYLVKDFPLDQLHPEARAAAVAARCAEEQGAFWEMHEALFARQQEWGGMGQGAADYFAMLGASLDLDGDAFAECQMSGRYDDIIQANLDEALSLGVRGTPSFFINGFPISGAQPFELFDYAVSLAEEGTLADAYVAPESEAAAEPTGPVEVEVGDAFSLGDPNAPVVMVEFTDLQCPFCARYFNQTFSQIKTNYIDTGKVRYVFKDFPLNSHPQAPKAAEAARCAGEQGEQLAMHGLIFSRQGEWSGRSDVETILIQLAAEVGIDVVAFSECLNSGRYEAAVSTDLAQGVRLGINGTPSFFLNGNFLSGAQPYEVFQQAIDSLLADAES